MKTKKQTAKQIINEHAETLKTMNHGELFRFSRDHDFDSRSGFAAFKRALLSEIDVDYNALRSEKRAEKQSELADKATATLTLYSDAKASHDRFAICDKDGEVVWYGKFFESDRDYNGEQSSGEMSAAKKAVWFANKVAESIGVKAINLTLKVDAKWLEWANAANDPDWDGKSGGKAKSLTAAAQRCNVILTVEWISGTSNPADKWTTAGSYKKWSDNDLKAMIEN